MQGFLDHLETARGHTLPSLLHAPREVWVRRFVRLNDAFNTLELFVDATLQERIVRLELVHAAVATADELGELLFSKPSAKIPLQHTRRFVFRVAVHKDPSSSHEDIHYFCAEQGNANDVDAGAVDTAASRVWMDQWLRALRATLQRAALSSSTGAVAAINQRDVHTKLATFVDALFVAAQVTARHTDADKNGQYEITVQAWTLQRELVSNDYGDEWEVLEYATAWLVHKTSAQLRDFDAQLRQRGVSDDLRDLPPPPAFSGFRAFVQSRVRDDSEESAYRVHSVDAYWQTLLCLPTFSVFGSDGSAMLDTFLDISRHLVGFKKLEKASGQNFHLRQKRIVPWRERQTFEQLFQMHQAMVRADEEARQRLMRQKAKTQRRERPQEKRPHHHDRHHRSVSDDDRRVSEPSAIETSPVETADAQAETADAVHKRIARIGHKLLVEAFTATAVHNTK